MITLRSPNWRAVSVLLVAAVLGLIGAIVITRGASGQPSDATVPGNVGVHATYENMGYRWSIEGDSNRNGRVDVRFREHGRSEWLEAMPPVRTHPNLVGEGNDRPDNRWAGSVFWLTPGQTYELELQLTDPDGGDETRVVTGTTRMPLALETPGRLLYVIPGDGGGSGGELDPFRGLQEAADNARPGDQFYLGPGIYESFQLRASGQHGQPIVFVGTGSDVVIDGAGTERGVVTLGNHDQTISNVIMDGMVVQNGRWGIDAQHSHDILVRHLTVRDVDYGYVNRRADAAEGRQTVCDSVFEGRTHWPAEGIPSERAIDLRGEGNVVCFNRIRGFGDGVSLQPMTGEAWGNDIYGNDITHIVDDPIEIDYNNANTRVWANRVQNGRMGISLAPIYGGPAYVFRNTFFNLESSAYKMNREPAGLVIAHNTSLKRGNGTSSPRNWQNVYFRNNFLFGTRYVFEEYGRGEGSVDDWDFDAFAREPACGGDTPPCFKWDNIRYATLADLQSGAGIEHSAVVGSRSAFLSPMLPEDYETPVAPDEYDLRLIGGVTLIDAGQPLPNLNTPWVDDGLPDIGAFEHGAEPPHYGPRYGMPWITYLAPSPSNPTPGTTSTTTPTATAIAATSTSTATQTTTATATDGTPAATASLPATGTATPETPRVTATVATSTPAATWSVFMPWCVVGR